MKRILIVLVCITVLFSFAGCGSTPESEPAEPILQTIEFAGVSMEVPVAWEYDASVSDNTMSFYKQYDDIGNLESALYISTDIFDRELDPDVELPAFLDGLTSVEEVTNASDPTDAKVDIYDAQYITYDQTIDGNTYSTKTYAVVNYNEIVTFTFGTLINNISDFDNAMRTVSIDLTDAEVEKEKAEDIAADEAKETEEVEETSSATLGEENALNTAHDYLDYSTFSYQGLIEQLEYEGYTNEEATYAADNCGADWNEQAAKKAQEYLDYSSFSRDGLIEQLEYEGFAYEQALYGVKSVGY